ncbi:MAG: response regulator transcription factor [Saccharospirillaceae bacterium]|nr:response regulator transcription factor [Pseudomonadales bacterium]NRB80068.1 response regulator transcription factor [Saccharospirillaceae bacterium]
MKRKILIIEDEAGIVFMLTDRLENEGYAVEHANDGIKGEKLALTNHYNLILLDVMLPKKDGFQVCQDLRKQNIQTPIIMLTARSTNIDTIMGLKLGADDYLSKPFDMQVLLARIEARLRVKPSQSHITNETYALNNQTIIKFDDFELDTLKQELSLKQQVITLNTQEYRLLNFFVTHPNQIHSRDELLNEVWGIHSNITTRTVDVHVAWLRKKLNDQPVAKRLITFRGRGYKFIK